MSNRKTTVQRREGQLNNGPDDELLVVLERIRQYQRHMALLVEQAMLLRLIEIRKRQQKRGRQ